MNVSDKEKPVLINLIGKFDGLDCSVKTWMDLFSHFKTPRSDLHCIFVNVVTWSLFCFECKDDLYIDSYKKLREACEMVKKAAEIKSVNEPATVALNNVSFYEYSVRFYEGIRVY